MSLVSHSMLLLGSSVLMSCVQPNLHRAAKSSVATAHADYEQRLQLPAGALTEKAALMTDPFEAGQPLCFQVLLRSFSEVDLRNTAVTLRADGRQLDASAQGTTIDASPPSSITYSGIVYRKHQAGRKTHCTSGHRDDGTCPEFGWVPTYATRSERGDVTIHESRGQVCFADQQPRLAHELALEVRIRLAKGGARKQVFRWNLTSNDPTSGDES